MAEERGKRRRISATRTEVGSFQLAKDCIKLHLISTPDELREDADGFAPEFVEGHFGEAGKIYGYEGLKVDIWFHSSSFYVYADIRYSALVQSGRKKAQNTLPATFKKIFGSALIEDRDTFLKQLELYNKEFSELLKENGEKLSTLGATENTLKELFRLDLRVPEARKWHVRLNPLILWFIEGASCIQVDDPRWEVYLAIETSQERHKVVGVCNVYRFFHYPENTRLRISQILVMPPYQRQNYGYNLVNTVNNIAIQRNCYDVTMEDPSDALQKLRDCMDLIRLLGYPPLDPKLEPVVESIRKKIKNKAFLLPPKDLANSVREHFKISKTQFKKCWEMLVYLHLGPGDEPARKSFRELLSDKINVELFEEENKQPGRAEKKRVIDTENEYDSSKTFVMMRFGGGSESRGEQAEAGEVGQPDEANKAEALSFLVEERVDQNQEVAKKVASISKLKGIPVKFDLQGWSAAD